MVKILMMSTKLTTPGLLKIKIFLNKDYDVKIHAHEVTNKILPSDLNHCRCGHVIKVW